jgi:HAD domain in Swiss Army Knife RNA repair proteins
MDNSEIKRVLTNKPVDGVAFLDFDGVICTARAFFAAGMDEGNTGFMRTLDPLSLALVDRLCLRYNLAVVISSTWRLEGQGTMTILRTHGFRSPFWTQHSTVNPDYETPWATPRKVLKMSRGEEISEWLKLYPEVDKYMCFDDNPTAAIQHPYKGVVCNVDDGVTFDNFWEADQLLSKQFAVPPLIETVPLT